ncbi:MAG: TonB-dependent receptor [Parasphingopyxis sp.]|uniref:TonB-dependent receptor plug domain-containing protein n=1 Tax=Parasphingopyxis sp. TaxID=1920299 RepID=UPI0032ECDE5A
MTNQTTSNRAKFAAGAAPIALGVAMLATPSTALAQEGATQGSAPIVVTGTRISRPDLESVSPLTVVGAEEIAATGTTRAEDLLNSLPQVVAGQNAFVSNGASGTATVNLRALGAVRTLVLIDGRRMPSGDPFATSPDINQIPAALVERIEVITGGASSTYGADAVSGVVNFIMNRDFEGIQADAQVSFYQHNNDNEPLQDLLDSRGFASPGGNPVDGFTYDANLAIGAGFDDGRGHVTAYVGYRQIDPILQANRDYSACALAFSAAQPSGYNCSGSGGVPEGHFLVFDRNTFGLTGDLINVDGQPGALRPYTGLDAYNYAPTNYFQRPDKRYTAGFFADYEISPSVIPYVDFMFMDDRSVAQIAFSGTFNGNNPILNCNNPLFSLQQAIAFGCDRDGSGALSAAELADTTDYVYINKRMIEGLPRQSDIRHTSYRAVVGVRGSISDNWSYDAHLLRGNTIYAGSYLNDLSVNRINQALDVVQGPNGPQCRNPANGCIPLNVFQVGGVTRQQFDFISVPGLQDADLETYVASGYVSGNLDNPLGTSAPISLVFGAEYRKEQYELLSDQNFAEGTLAGQGGPSPSLAGEFSVREVFTELRLPIVEWANGGAIELTGGYRLSDYNTSGTSHTYTGGVEIQPIEGIRLRGVYARAVRAPNVVELFSPQSVGLFAGTDPCAGATPTATLAACQNTGVSAVQYGNIAANPANQYNQLGGGNPNLDVEKADSYTVGLVVDGRSLGLDGFTATIDYFNIEISDAISGVGAQTALNQCLATGLPEFCNLVNRAPGSGSLWIGQNGFVINTQQNIGGLKTDGIDISAGYRFPVWTGSLSLAFTGTYTFENAFQTLPTAAFIDCAGFYGNVCGSPQPDWRHRATIGYTADAGWGVTFRWRHFGSVDYDGGPGTAAVTIDDTIDSYDWFDLNVSYDITDNLRLSGGVNNVFDREPPTIGGAFAGGFSNGNTYPGQYDPVGRYVYFGGRIQF